MSDTITITGNLAAEPEQRLIGNGATVTNFRVASPQRHQDRSSGQWVDAEPNWYQVSAFRGLGEHVFASVRKGDPVIVTGRLKVRRWENERGKGVSVEIVADSVGHDLRWGTAAYTKAGGRAHTDEWDVAGPATAKDRDASREWSVQAPGSPASGVGAAPDDAPRRPAPDGAETQPAPPLPGLSAGQSQELVDAPF